MVLTYDFCPEDGSSIFLLNAVTYRSACKVSHPRRPAPPSELHIQQERMQI